jgi:fatty-acyl-CoA synthase
MIKTGGANVSPLEIEQALAGHSALRVARAVGVPHPTLGEVVVLCAVPAEGAGIDEDALRLELKGRLAGYKVPKRVLSFLESEIEFTGTQKVALAGLRSAALRKLSELHAEIEGYRY